MLQPQKIIIKHLIQGKIDGYMETNCSTKTPTYSTVKLIKSVSLISFYYILLYLFKNK